MQEVWARFYRCQPGIAPGYVYGYAVYIEAIGKFRLTHDSGYQWDLLPSQITILD